MPDIPNRDAIEAEVARLLGKWMKEQQKLILQLLGDPPSLANLPPEFWNEIGAEGVSILRPFMTQQALAASERTLAGITIGVDWALVNESAATWARQYSYELVTGINQTSRQTLQRIIPGYFEDAMTQGELTQAIQREMSQAVGNVFSPVRAEMIARTEVTRAAFEGEQITIGELAKEGVNMIGIWGTRNDEIVCVICGPMHGREADGYTPPRRPYWIHPEMGMRLQPPAHPRCRCGADYRSSKV